jgi:hypothetical protein
MSFLLQVEQKVDFAGREVKIEKEVEVGSKEHEALQVQMLQGHQGLCGVECLRDWGE